MYVGDDGLALLQVGGSEAVDWQHDERRTDEAARSDIKNTHRVTFTSRVGDVEATDHCSQLCFNICKHETTGDFLHTGVVGRLLVSDSPCRTLGALDLLTVSLHPWRLTWRGDSSTQVLRNAPRSFSTSDCCVIQNKRISTFAERLVVGAAVSSLQAVLWAVAGVVIVPLLPTAILSALKASRWPHAGEFISLIQ